MSNDIFCREVFEVDVVQVFEAAQEAVKYTRSSGKGPLILEMQTYRYRGHSMSDPAKYRTKDELEEKKKSDPLAITEDRLRKDFGVTEEQLQAVKNDVEQVAQDAYTFAEESPVPDPATLYDHVYAGT